MKVYEYETICIAFDFSDEDADDFKEILNDKGAKGWELVSCFARSIGSEVNDTTERICAVLKRISD